MVKRRRGKRAGGRGGQGTPQRTCVCMGLKWVNCVYSFSNSGFLRQRRAGRGREAQLGASKASAANAPGRQLPTHTCAQTGPCRTPHAAASTQQPGPAPAPSNPPCPMHPATRPPTTHPPT